MKELEEWKIVEDTTRSGETFVRTRVHSTDVFPSACFLIAELLNRGPKNAVKNPSIAGCLFVNLHVYDWKWGV